MLHFIHKNVSRVIFGKVWFSDLPITWLLFKWLACHMPSRSQWRVAAIMTSLSWHHHHHNIIYFAFTKMADSQNSHDRQKYTQLLPSIYTFCGLIFQKPLTCIRSDIVLHVIRNAMKIGKKQRTMLAQTQYSVLSASLCSVGVCVCVCVCVCVMSGFQILHCHLPRKLVTGNIKFLSKIRYFPDRPTRLSGPYVNRTKQLFCHGLMPITFSSPRAQPEVVFFWYQNESPYFSNCKSKISASNSL